MGFLDKLLRREPKPVAQVDTAPQVHTSLGDNDDEKLFFKEKVKNPTWEASEQAANDAAALESAHNELEAAEEDTAA